MKRKEKQKKISIIFQIATKFTFAWQIEALEIEMHQVSFIFKHKISS